MKVGKTDEADEQKRQVESVNKVAGSAEEDLTKVFCSPLFISCLS